jgi:hypothetical protein
MNLEYRTSHANFANPTFTQAGFTYSMILNLVKIQDTGKGAKSVTNDIENVLREIEVWHQGSIAGYRIMYRDTEGWWDGVEWNGEHARFFAIREIDEAAAKKKLLAHKAE